MAIAQLKAPAQPVRPQTAKSPPKVGPSAAPRRPSDSLQLSLEATKRQAPSSVAGAVNPNVAAPMRPGNSLELYVDGKQAYAALNRVVDSARTRIDFEFFAFHDDATGRAMADKLIAKAKSGVQVNLLLDFLNYRKSKDLMERMSAGGVNVRAFVDGHEYPWIHVNSLTDHRKVALVDGKVAVSGGMNIGEPYEKNWHDLMFKVEGPTVQDYYRYFEQNWSKSKGAALRPLTLDTSVRGRHSAQVAVTTPTEQEIRKSTIAAYDSAKTSIMAQSPYFIDDEVIAALTRAAKRGVDVHVIIPGKGDNPFVDIMNADVRKYFVEAGIKVHQYDTKNPAIKGHDHALDRFNHGKVAVVDGQYVMIGTANADNRSMAISREINLHVDSPEFAKEVTARVFEHDFNTRAPRRTEQGSILYPLVDRVPALSKIRELF